MVGKVGADDFVRAGRVPALSQSGTSFGKLENNPVPQWYRVLKLTKILHSTMIAEVFCSLQEVMVSKSYPRLKRRFAAERKIRNGIWQQAEQHHHDFSRVLHTFHNGMTPAERTRTVGELTAFVGICHRSTVINWFNGLSAPRRLYAIKAKVWLHDRGYQLKEFVGIRAMRLVVMRLLAYDLISIEDLFRALGFSSPEKIWAWQNLDGHRALCADKAILLRKYVSEKVAELSAHDRGRVLRGVQCFFS